MFAELPVALAVSLCFVGIHGHGTAHQIIGQIDPHSFVQVSCQRVSVQYNIRKEVEVVAHVIRGKRRNVAAIGEQRRGKSLLLDPSKVVVSILDPT